MDDANKKKLWDELLRIARETKEFGYIPSRYLQDVANSDPAELVFKYVAKDPTEGLWPDPLRLVRFV